MTIITYSKLSFLYLYIVALHAPPNFKSLFDVGKKSGIKEIGRKEMGREEKE